MALTKMKSRSGGASLLGQQSNVDLSKENLQLTAETPYNAWESAKGSLMSAGKWAMDNPEYITAAGKIGSAAIIAGNNEYNNQYGSYSDSSALAKEGILGNIPVIGGIAQAVNSVGGMVGAGLNKGNEYNEYGYNEREQYGKGYMQLGGLFDPFSMSMRALEKGGEGSGGRALFAWTGFGGAAQYAFEQQEAKEREALAKKQEDSAWQLNQFNYSPNFDV